ncbi:MAG: winged helix-turn-helix domain-containing protein [Draconibacterium sp.]
MLKSKIGINAGEIWQFLDKNGEITFSEIEQALPMGKADTMMAIGWLARENKVSFYEKGDDILVSLVLHRYVTEWSFPT